jgi:hypothetical protein
MDYHRCSRGGVGCIVHGPRQRQKKVTATGKSAAAEE